MQASSNSASGAEAILKVRSCGSVAKEVTRARASAARALYQALTRGIGPASRMVTASVTCWREVGLSVGTMVMLTVSMQEW